MPDITDPAAITFCNEHVRPIAETIRAMKVRGLDMTTIWFGGMNNKFPNDSSAVQDNREAAGVSRLTGADVNSVISIIIAVDEAINDEIIAKPCVRPLNVT